MTGNGNFHVLLAGGGTGGHVFPALAVGEELTRRGATVSFAGSPTGFEARVVPERGLPFHPLRSKPLVGRSVAGKVAAVLTVLWASLSAAVLLRRLGVDAVLGTGGYASVPGVCGAILARRPVLLLEPNAQPGFANRKVARGASGVAVAFQDTCRHLDCECRLTGVPVREEFFRVPELAAPVDRPPRLLVLGGSQGALSVNLAVPRMLGGERGLLALLPGVTVVHQTGRAHLDATREAYREAGVPEGAVDLVPFIGDVAGAMAAADLVVSRAGALTVSEIAAAGRPAVLLPLTLAEGHQRENARTLEKAGAARVVEAEPGGDSDALAGSLRPVLAELLGAPESLAAMGRAARGQSRSGATAAIADWLLDLARSRRGAGGGSA